MSEQSSGGTYRPPSDAVAHMSPTANWDGFERRCCPNCRLYFDAAEDSDAVFCSDACERRHERGELKADGGGVTAEASSVVFDRWIGKAGENIDKWGLQDEETLLLAIQEELGELTQAVLEARAEDGDPERIDEELDDLGALLLQFHERRKRRSLSTGGDRDAE